MKSGKTFICYAHLDKDRFVSDFWKKLMSFGVDVSIDDLDIHPGDSLPRKIFEDCIDNCENFIVVLSKNSINSKWVNEELDAGMIQKIEKGARLIPIVLDDLDRKRVPNRLGHIHLHYIEDINNFMEDAKYIANICLGLYERPKPEARKIDLSNVGKIPGLETIDIYIFETIIKTFMEDDKPLISAKDIVARVSDEFTSKEIEESLEILDSKRYIKLHRTITEGILDLPITINNPGAVIQYIEYCYDDYNNLILKPLATYILDNGEVWMSSRNLTEELNINHFLLRQILDWWEIYDYILCSKSISGDTTFMPKANGNRYFRKVLE